MPVAPATKPVITRFAPSPTGALHIGGARTALFAWAYARKHNGKFILRIEDTDLKRSSPESTKGIIRDLMWLGLNWDQGPKGPCMKSGCGCGKAPDEDFDPYGRQIGDAGPYFQSQRAAQGLYDQYIDLLLQAGEAYEDGGAVRLKMGTHRGDIAFDDAVYGHIEVPAADLEDFVIRKGADGGKLPTFHFAVVIDDALMGVTHVIRGQEHLTNTTKHAAIYDALAKVTGDTETWQRPVWVHTPSIMNPGGSKMSKRDKAKVARASFLDGKITDQQREAFVSDILRIQELPPLIDPVPPIISSDDIKQFVEGKNDSADIASSIAYAMKIDLPEIDVHDFYWSGYLPNALLNYIALLGWNPGNDREHFDLDFLKQEFSFDRIGKSNSTFDRQKLLEFNRIAIAELSPGDFASKLWANPATSSIFLNASMFTDKSKADFGTQDHPNFRKFAEATQQRAKTLSDPLHDNRYLFSHSDIAYDFAPKPIRKAMTGSEGQGLKLLAELRDAFANLHEDGFGTAAHDLMNKLAEETGINMGKYAQPVRVAVSGGVVTPPLDLTLDLLGKEKTLARIENCLSSKAARAAIAKQ